MRKRHRSIAATAKASRLSCTSPVRPSRPRKPTEIVEADLRRRKPGKPRTRLRVQIAQQSIANSVMRHPTQLLLDDLQRPPERRAPSQCLLNFNRA